jgi:hypothetical protein
MRYMLGFVFFFGVAGCSSGGAKCSMGDESCPCFSNSTCNGSLTCKSKVCIDLGSLGKSNQKHDAGSSDDAGASGDAGTRTSGARDAGSQASTGDAASDAGSGSGAGGSNGSAGSSGACQRQCGNRKCGPDPMCQESCGTCNAGLKCVEGACEAPAPLKSNGDTCSAATECASGVCQMNQVGELHCYGTAGANHICGDVFDCAGGLCVPMTRSGSGGVCIPGVSVCYQRQVPNECVQSTIATCQLVQSCGSQNSSSVPAKYLTDFDYCVRNECTTIDSATLSTTDCVNIVNNISNGTAHCL